MRLYGAHCEQMATAILRYFTASGLVVGADGKKCDPDTGKVFDNTTQKIFEIPGVPVAYAMYGEIGVGDDDPEGPILLDLSVELERLIATKSRPINLLAYAGDLGGELENALAKARAAGAIFHGQQESISDIRTIARILFFGYLDGLPSEVNIQLVHRDQILRHGVFPVDLGRSNPEVFGSAVIAQRLFPQPQPTQVSLLKAAQEIERYIQACDSEEGRAADPFCNFIGGRVHIAAITPNGFQWLKPPA